MSPSTTGIAFVHENCRTIARVNRTLYLFKLEGAVKNGVLYILIRLRSGEEPSVQTNCSRQSFAPLPLSSAQITPQLITEVTRTFIISLNKSCTACRHKPTQCYNRPTTNDIFPRKNLALLAIISGQVGSTALSIHWPKLLIKWRGDKTIHSTSKRSNSSTLQTSNSYGLYSNVMNAFMTLTCRKLPRKFGLLTITLL